jgi:hypothetical protein
MKNPVQLINATDPVRNSLNRPLWRRGFLLIQLALASFALAPQAQAVCQEGCDLVNSNTFLGDNVLTLNTTGNFNTGIGASALSSNTSGSDNTATGLQALRFNTTGVSNTAIGFIALQNNTTGSNNTATGPWALTSNTTGSDNTANGENALFSNRTGHSNIALGIDAGFNLTTGSNNIDIGNVGRAGESRTIRIGRQGTQTGTFIAGISGVTVANGVGVIIDTNGQLGTVVSSQRFKDTIKPMDKASEAILSLQPVTFRYKHDLDPEGIPQFGLVAEQVAKVDPDLVARDDQGKPYTVRYEAVNAMLLNEFLKEHRKVEAQDRKVQELEATVAQLKSVETEQTDLKATVAQQQTEIRALASQIQKVSSRLAVSQNAPATLVDNR